MLFKIPFSDFMKQVALWNINPQGKEKVDYEEYSFKGKEYYAFYLSLPYKIYVTVIEKIDLDPVQRSLLIPITQLGERVKPNEFIEDALESIKKEMKNASTNVSTYSNRDNIQE